DWSSDVCSSDLRGAIGLDSGWQLESVQDCLHGLCGFGDACPLGVIAECDDKVIGTVGIFYRGKPGRKCNDARFQVKEEVIAVIAQEKLFVVFSCRLDPAG